MTGMSRSRDFFANSATRNLPGALADTHDIQPIKTGSGKTAPRISSVSPSSLEADFDTGHRSPTFVVGGCSCRFVRVFGNLDVGPEGDPRTYIILATDMERGHFSIVGIIDGSPFPPFPYMRRQPSTAPIYN